MSKSMERSFRKLFLVEPSHDFSAARKYSERIAFITDGGERAGDLYEKIEASLEDFDPLTDAIIPMGRVIACWMVGIVIGKKYPDQQITVGVYRGDKYEFVTTKGLLWNKLSDISHTHP